MREHEEKGEGSVLLLRALQLLRSYSRYVYYADLSRLERTQSHRSLHSLTSVFLCLCVFPGPEKK